MKFRLKAGIECGIKHQHKFKFQSRGSIQKCCHCGNDEWKVTHVPNNPPLGMGNWDDRYHIQCQKCMKEMGVWELDDLLLDK